MERIVLQSFSAHATAYDLTCCLSLTDDVTEWHFRSSSFRAALLKDLGPVTFVSLQAAESVQLFGCRGLHLNLLTIHRSTGTCLPPNTRIIFIDEVASWTQSDRLRVNTAIAGLGRSDHVTSKHWLRAPVTVSTIEWPSQDAVVSLMMFLII